MAVSVLEIDDFLSDDFSLIALTTSLEDYKLAYLINKNCQISLQRSLDPLLLTKFELQIPFSIYYFNDNPNQLYWSLISNRCVNSTLTLNSSYELEELKVYSDINLVPECKSADYFLKIEENVSSEFINETLEKIKKITGITTAFEVEKNTLISINNLLF